MENLVWVVMMNDSCIGVFSSLDNARAFIDNQSKLDGESPDGGRKIYYNSYRFCVDEPLRPA